MELLTKLGINWQLLIAQIVNFLILLVILTRFVYKPFLNLLDERAERIRKAMDDAEKLEAETVRMGEQRKEQLKAIDEEAGRMLSEARVHAEKIQEELLIKARAEAAHIVEQGIQKLQDERAKALQELQETSAKMIVQLTETLLRREFSKPDQQKILQEISASIPSLLS